MILESRPRTYCKIATIYEGDDPTVACCLEQSNKLTCSHNEELQEKKDPEPVAYLGQVMSKPNVLLYEKHHIILPLQELPIIIKVYHLQVAHQMKQNTG